MGGKYRPYSVWEKMSNKTREFVSLDFLLASHPYFCFLRLYSEIISIPQHLSLLVLAEENSVT